MEGNNSKTCKSCLTSFWQNSKKLHNSETRPVDLMSSQKDNSVKLILLLNKFLANFQLFQLLSCVPQVSTMAKLILQQKLLRRQQLVGLYIQNCFPTHNPFPQQKSATHSTWVMMWDHVQQQPQQKGSSLIFPSFFLYQWIMIDDF